MNINILCALKIFAFVTLFSGATWAQDQGSTDESFDSLMNEPASVQNSQQKGAESLTLLVEDLSREDHSFYGISVGLLGTAQTFDATVVIYNPSDANVASISQKVELSNFQYVGALLRYSILPIDRIGTDLNISYATSMNHASIEKKSISIIKGELNLGYTLKLNQGIKIYALLGGGVQDVQGSDINLTTERMGYGGQAGLGFNFARVNVETVYSYYRHNLSNTFLQSGTTTAAPKANQSFIEAKGLVGRASFNF